MKLLLTVKDIPIFVSDKFSFFNSPYIGHKTGCAIDIYSPLSPIDGYVKKIIKLRHDYLLLIECSDNSSVYAKILHVKPFFHIGDHVHIGDSLGTLIWSNYFSPWTDPHIHLELRHPDDAIRATGGHKLVNSEKCNIEFRNIDIEVNNIEHYDQYVKATLPEIYFEQINGYFGFKFGEGIICGGLPHYDYGAYIQNQISIFKCPPLKITLNEKPIKGISFYLNVNRMTKLKLICDTDIDIPQSGILNIQENHRNIPTDGR